MNQPFHLSVIIVNWNTRGLLQGCLESLYNNLPDGELEIIVVDNASTDGSLEMLHKHFPQVKVIANSQNLGFARANNQAIQISRGDVILLLNSDTLILPGSLSNLFQCLEAYPDAGIFGGKLLNKDGSFQSSYNDFPNLISELLLMAGLARRVYTNYYPSYPAERSLTTCYCDWVGGAFLLVRRAVCEQVGLLDENYFMYAEEVDWCYRAHQAGWRVVYCADAPIIHFGGQSASRSSYRQQLLLYRSKARYFLIHHGRLCAQVFGFVVKVAALLKAIYWAATSLVWPERRENAAVAWDLARTF
ncbi:MAG TPA: glycosyltransferase family 2 protein [Anaerolineales bacterium]|nr:glycosyltransferase family 2 protein [Anaerolineales bacterium]